MPIWRMPPSTITPTRSARAAASSKSCVTSSAGSPQLRQEPLELAAHARAGVGVESRQRLVEEQDGRIGGQRPREPDPLALAAGELSGPDLRQVRDAEPLEQLVGPRLPPNATFSRTLMCGKSAYSWNT